MILFHHDSLAVDHIDALEAVEALGLLANELAVERVDVNRLAVDHDALDAVGHQHGGGGRLGLLAVRIDSAHAEGVLIPSISITG